MPTGAINERAPGGGSVLVVDDEAAIRQLLVRWLTAAGYRCLEADCMAAADADRVRLAAPMHDIGKIGIPDGILRKPGRLTEAEFEVMKQHTTLGAAMLASSSSPVLRMAHDIALFHHERWDGLGYPLGVAGESIPEAARILTIVDVYDALTHDRVYRAALPETEVLRRMQSKQGRHFDPELLCAFLSILEEVQQIAAQYPDEALKHLSACFPSRLPTAVHTPSLLVGPSDP
jgi:response regulator RpfG family c-di-GMP phosphodiesterase